MRPIGIRKSCDTKFLEQFLGTVYIYKNREETFRKQLQWWSLYSGKMADSEHIVNLKRKLPTIEESL